MERLNSILKIIKTPNEILQIIELHLDDIFFESYEDLELLLNNVEQKIRIFVLDIFKKHNKLPQINKKKIQEQLLDFNLEENTQNVQETKHLDNLYDEIFEKLLDNNILLCTNVVELAIFTERCPNLLFKLLDLVKGNSEITDKEKKFIIGIEGYDYIKNQMKEQGEEQIAKILSNIFWDTHWYICSCKGFGIQEHIYTPYVEQIKKDNFKINILNISCNLHDYKINESRLSQLLINDVLYRLEFYRTGDNHIQINITKQSILDKLKCSIFSKKLHVSRGVNLDLNAVLDKNDLRTYHLK